MKKNLGLLILLIGILIFGFSLKACSTPKSFYQVGSGWDHLRFPLLEPYYAIKITDEYGWQVPVNAEPSKSNFRYYMEILNVTQIAVENDMIMVYSTFSEPIIVDISEDGVITRKELHWFIIIPDQSETGFETEEEFNISLQQLGMDQPRWQEPLSILQTFDQTRCLEWIPDCK